MIGARTLAVVIAWLAMSALMVTPPATAATESFAAEADTYVSEPFPRFAGGSAAVLRIDGDPVRRTYLRFDTTSLEGTVTRATLRLTRVRGTAAGLTASVVQGAWSESATTATTAPAPAGGAAATGAVVAGSTIELDVTALLSGPGPLNLVLTTASPDATAIAGRERGAGTSVLVVDTDAVPPPPPAEAVVMAAGDIACSPLNQHFLDGQGTGVFCRQAATAALVAGEAPDAVLALGDLQYEVGGLAHFLESYDRSWGRFKRITRPVAGNHEYLTGAARGYFDYFNGQGADDGPAGRRGVGYYSFDLGAWHLVALNSNCDAVGGCEAGSPQVDWLRRDLAASGARCTLAYWHHPRYSSGGHGDTPAMTTVWQVLYDAGADLVLAGHDHNYERFAPQDAHRGADPARGLREFVVGTGGKGVRVGAGQTKPNSEAFDDSTLGVLRLGLHPGGYDWRFLPVDGSFADAGSAACH